MEKLNEIEKFIDDLKVKSQKYYASRSEHVDNTIKNDDRAIRILTSLETQEIEENDIIDKFLEVCKQYFNNESDFTEDDLLNCISLKNDRVENRRS